MMNLERANVFNKAHFLSIDASTCSYFWWCL